MDKLCPTCGKPFTLHAEYMHSSEYHYDGISEHKCDPCNLRIGRWSGKVLKDGEYEYPFGRIPHTS